MKTIITIAKNCISNLKNEENKKQFAKELYEANEYENLNTVIYYDLDNQGIYCDAITQGTIISNSIYLTILQESINFEEMDEEEYKVFLDNLIEELGDMNNWIFYEKWW